MKTHERALASVLSILLLALVAVVARAFVIDTSSCLSADLQWGIFCNQ